MLRPAPFLTGCFFFTLSWFLCSAMELIIIRNNEHTFRLVSIEISTVPFDHCDHKGFTPSYESLGRRLCYQITLRVYSFCSQRLLRRLCFTLSDCPCLVSTLSRTLCPYSFGRCTTAVFSPLAPEPALWSEPHVPSTLGRPSASSVLLAGQQTTSTLSNRVDQ